MASKHLLAGLKSYLGVWINSEFVEFSSTKSGTIVQQIK